jgi:hypothetical protein
VDLKWLFGLACLASILIAGGLYSASKLTERDPATGIFTGVMTSFAKEGEGSEQFEELQARAAANPDQEFAIEGVTLPVKGNELVGLSYDEAVGLVVARIAEMLYADGPGAVEQYFEDPSGVGSEGESTGESENVNLGPFSLLTQDGHDTLRAIFTYSLVPILILALPLVLFSRRFGRLGSLGVVLVAGTAPFAVLWLAAKQVTTNSTGDGVEGALAEALSPTATDVSSTFLRLLLLGVALILVAVAGQIGFALWHHFRHTPTPAVEDETATDEPSEEDVGAEVDDFPYVAPDAAPPA